MSIYICAVSMLAAIGLCLAGIASTGSNLFGIILIVLFISAVVVYCLVGSRDEALEQLGLEYRQGRIYHQWTDRELTIFELTRAQKATLEAEQRRLHRVV